MGLRGKGWILGGAAAIAIAIPALALSQSTPTTPSPLPLPTPGYIVSGVSIGGVPVGGLSQAAATQAVLAQFVGPHRTPVVVSFRGRRIGIDPTKVGYAPDVAYAVQVALLYGRSQAVPAGGVDVPVRQQVNRKRLIALLKLRAATHNLPPRDATLAFRGATPFVVKARVGISIDIAKSIPVVEQAITLRAKPVYPLVETRVRPKVTTIGPAIIIQRNSFRLTLWRPHGKRHSFPIAVGQPAYPTPTGRYQIITMQKNPTWFPPNSPWAAGLGPIPPGVSNPLGTRWMGTSAPGIGIHGTPIPGSIGTAASHGCIRMRIPDAEYIYGHVHVGTPVIIV